MMRTSLQQSSQFSNQASLSACLIGCHDILRLHFFSVTPFCMRQHKYAVHKLVISTKCASTASSQPLMMRVVTYLRHCWTRYYSCCSAREVQLSALSPVLSQMASTAIPIPGLVPCNPIPPSHPHGGLSSALASESAGASEPPYQVSSADLVTVSSFKPSVHVMSTKTRPKRIGMVGSDGRTYTFLLKVCLAHSFPCF